MPELAEVEAVRKHLDRVMRGKKIREVTVDPEDRFLFAFASAPAVRKTLLGATVIGSGRRGKYFWLQLKNRGFLILHLGMTGNVAITLPKSKKPPTHVWGGLTLQSQKTAAERPERLWFCRLLIELADGTQIGVTDPRRFGRLWLSDDPPNHPRVKKLGPDPLLDFPTAKILFAKLQRRKMKIKAVLMDQSLFAGIGNWLADEILYQARLSPHHLASDLSLKDVTHLRSKILGVVKKAVSVDADYERFPKSWLFHDRWGKAKNAKTAAGQKIIHEEIGGRTTAWVPTLQK